MIFQSDKRVDLVTPAFGPAMLFALQEAFNEVSIAAERAALLPEDSILTISVKITKRQP